VAQGKSAFRTAYVRGQGEARIACLSCERRSYKAGGVLRCVEWKRFSQIVRCSKYIGPHAQCHFKVAGGPQYHDTLAHAGIRR
jgi:hypothetical protein